MKILFEGQDYKSSIFEEYGITAKDSLSTEGKNNGKKQIPAVGYFYSRKINDIVFILPKVFIFETDDGTLKAFGAIKYDDINDQDKSSPVLKEKGIDKILFELSTWVYRSIQKYDKNFPENDIVKRVTSRNVKSTGGDNDITLLDTILSLIEFNKKQGHLLTFITKLDRSGRNNINWNKTIRKISPIFIDDIPYYLEFINKSKEINWNEELITLFYSTLNYLKDKFGFELTLDLNYKLIKPGKIEQLIESQKGARLLKKIKRHYFRDELVKMWKLLHSFYTKAEEMKSGKIVNEELTVTKYDEVFENMVDELINDDTLNKEKKNKDGKEIDHLFKGKSLIGSGNIIFIGDSKYYFANRRIEGTALHKQFTYAKNVIQERINKAINDAGTNDIERDGIRYRDGLTEGYNITPNFFIRGEIKEEYISNGRLDLSTLGLKVHKSTPERQKHLSSKHFDNRLFDRDTLRLHEFDINFLFVLCSYVRSRDNSEERRETRNIIRREILKWYKEKYDFFKVTPNDIKCFTDMYFRKYIGQMYHDKDASHLWMAFEAGTKTKKDLEEEFIYRATVDDIDLLEM